MGTVFKRGRVWGINFVDSNGQQVRRMVSPYRETAEKVLKKTEVDIIEGRYFDIKKNQNVLFEDFAEEYLKNHVRSENRNYKKQACIIRKLVGHFRGSYLYRIDTRMIQAYQTKRLQEVKPSSVNRHLAMLRSMFNRAIEWGILADKNPAVGVRKLAENNERTRWLTEREQAFLLSHCHGLTRVIVVIALQTGMRWGEIVSLKWQQAPQSNYVDLENGIAFIHESLTKSKKSRFIPLSYAVKTELKNLPRTQGSEYVFVNPKTRKPLNNIRKSFARAVQLTSLKDFKFHDLRHTFASSLVGKGVDLYAVQKLLGHATPTMTQRYAHLQPDHLHSAIEKIDLHFNCLV